MYIIKQIPEDFVVKEIFPLPKTDLGSYSYWWMQKTSLNTLEAVSKIAGQLHIPLKFIKFAGNKDRNAVTRQIISIYKAPKSAIESLRITNLSLEFIGFYKEPVFVGAHQGNSFVITVRNLEHGPKKVKNVPNYFGQQRFSKENVAIGRLFVKKDFKSIARLLQGERSLAEHLKGQSGDFVGAIKRLPKQLMKLYIHSYQSHIWNKTTGRYLEKNTPAKQVKVPIAGFATELRTDKLSKIIGEILHEEKITTSDFIIKQIPEISQEGGERDLFMEVGDLKIGKSENDELNPSKKKCVLSFSLPKGSYATVIIDFLFK